MIGNLAKCCKVLVFKLTGSAFSLILFWEISHRVLDLEPDKWGYYYIGETIGAGIFKEFDSIARIIDHDTDIFC